MSYLDRRISTLIGSGPLVAGGDPVLLDESPSIEPAGWDSNQFVYGLRRASLTAEEIAELFPVGRRLDPSRAWWVTGAKPEAKAPGYWEITVSAKGWAAVKACKVDWGSASETQSAENIRAPISNLPPGSGTRVWPKISVAESTATFALSYLVENVQAGWPVAPLVPTDKIGRERTASAAWNDPNDPFFHIGPPPLPETVWGELSEYVYHWPNGWVLMSLEVDQLAGCLAGLVSERYQYVRPISP